MVAFVRAAALCIPLALLALAPLSAQEKKKETLRAACTRDDALFKTGENATFRIESDTDGEVNYALTEDGHKNVKSGKLTLEKGKPAEVSGTLEKPGFLQLRVTRDKQVVLAAAAFDPTKITPTAKPPEDFDAYWDAAKQELAKVPLDAKLERSEKHSDAKVDCFKVSLASVGGRRVHGWISVPKGKGPFPAILTVPYAGVYGIEPDKQHALLGALSMNIIVHDIPVDEKPEFYAKQDEGALKDYRNIGIDDAQKNYFRFAILACLRAADYVTGRPDFDGKSFAVTGGSQGGGLSLILAGLDPRVKLVASNVPALCDHSGLAHDRVSGWPQWLRRARGEKDSKIERTAAYFDAVNFARKFTGQALVGVGFLDTACAPTTVYSAFNVLPETKTMIASPRMGHGTDPRYGAARQEFWKKNLPLRPPE